MTEDSSQERHFGRSGGALDVSVVLPTYNEAGNIQKAIVGICSALRNEGMKGEVLIVDDNSPDGTAAIAERLSEDYPVRVHVRRDTRGLATAVIKGFELSRGTVCVVMDADLSHPAERLGAMVKPVLQGHCDATVGSRYMGGGGSQQWPLARRIISKGSGFLAKGVTRLSDPTSGFMAIRRSLIETALLDPIGWKIVLETIVKLRPRFMEIPIVFSDRQEGASKLDRKVQIDYLRHLWRLYCYRFAGLVQFLKFCAVGFTGLVVDTFVLVSLVELLALDPRLAAVFAFLAAVTWNYGLNKRWTFSQSGQHLFSYSTFVIVSCAGFGVRIGVMQVLLEYGGMSQGRLYVLASIAGILCATVFNYVGAKYLSFGRPAEVLREEHYQ